MRSVEAFVILLPLGSTGSSYVDSMPASGLPLWFRWTIWAQQAVPLSAREPSCLLDIVLHNVLDRLDNVLHSRDGDSPQSSRPAWPWWLDRSRRPWSRPPRR